MRATCASPLAPLPGNVVFFPVAAAYAMLVLPASVSSMLGMTGAFPGIATPSGHAHEMLFGFALAVVAGNQLVRAGTAHACSTGACFGSGSLRSFFRRRGT